MLQLFNVKKDYYAAGETVHALRGVSLSFRKNEFVSILGPSGCGKTTLLNIIGGLDKYTEGELTIAGKPTPTTSLRSSLEDACSPAGCPIPIWSSAPAVRSACPISCCGSLPTLSSILPTCCGLISPVGSCTGPLRPIRAGTAGMEEFDIC